MIRPRQLRHAASSRLARILVVVVPAVVVVATVAGVAGSTSPRPPLDKQAVAQHLQKTAGRFMTAPAQAALAMLANNTRQFGMSARTSQDGADAGATSSALRIANGAPTSSLGPGLTNVRVNNPAGDTQFIDQTTQSETAIAVAGQNIVVGYNDSQTTGLFLTAGSDLSGYSYSSDGGQTFTDGGALPNAPAFINLGDPWLGSDRAGNVYYANLMIDGQTGELDVGVAKSTNGGKTFSAPTVISPRNNLFYFGDKESLAVGPDPKNKSRDNIYVAWDDDSLDENYNEALGLPVAHSTDGGNTWQVTYADQIPLDYNTCSFAQYIGATPAVAPNGVLYVAAEKFSVTDPDCTFDQPFVASEWIFKSTDGGQTFGPGKQISTVTETGDLSLGPGMVMRNLELPTIALGQGGGANAPIYVAWNDAASGHSNIRLATSTDGSKTWKLAWATNGPNDQMQPALSSDSSGLHLLYYQRNPDNTLDVVAASSTNGKPPFAPTRVTSQSFPGVFTFPQFDPIIAFGYMGDYIANVSDGTDQYYVWGDNRDTVTNILWPQGRHDPDVFFAKQ